MKKPAVMIPILLGKLKEKPVTVMYPAEKLKPFDHIRSKIKFISEKCIGCSMCARDCPSAACVMVEKPGPNNRKKSPEFDLDRCTFCAQCEESCPKDAIEMTADYEMAHFNRGELVIK